MLNNNDKNNNPVVFFYYGNIFNISLVNIFSRLLERNLLSNLFLFLWHLEFLFEIMLWYTYSLLCKNIFL